MKDLLLQHFESTVRAARDWICIGICLRLGFTIADRFLRKQNDTR